MRAGGYYHYTIINALMHKPCPNSVYCSNFPHTKSVATMLVVGLDIKLLIVQYHVVF